MKSLRLLILLTIVSVTAGCWVATTREIIVVIGTPIILAIIDETQKEDTQDEDRQVPTPSDR